ncbi:MAG: 1-(5-phosphoribosyl)-5-[(5-phosphoribosylamino)methylideneamino]imidazole-4-carboxamide isomerase [Elusimicrobia bacterium]|nr:1-(5-phosphoribosyl)-5-[(5-phosphoribosylamino)methylideneamino]imidazole-4-carboxamide isomerase [Elusimicrobiota bacterium]
MLIIPAIDIRGGNCVMLKQGKIEEETIYSKDPVFMAKLWQAKGAKRLHVVDLDGALGGKLQNFEIIKKIKEAVNIPVQVGGGLRSIESVDSLKEIGIDYVIMGTVAIYNPDILRKALEKYGDKIIVAVDARDGNVAIGGWKDTTSVTVNELLAKLKEMNVDQVLYTDIQKDGMLEGPNLKGLKNVAGFGIKVIASGGVTNLEDVKNIKKLEKEGVIGAVVGKALYTENLKLEEAIQIAEQ